jgi:hypothetical protein
VSSIQPKGVSANGNLIISSFLARQYSYTINIAPTYLLVCIFVNGNDVLNKNFKQVSLFQIKLCLLLEFSWIFRLPAAWSITHWEEQSNGTSSSSLQHAQHAGASVLRRNLRFTPHPWGPGICEGGRTNGTSCLQSAGLPWRRGCAIGPARKQLLLGNQMMNI